MRKIIGPIVVIILTVLMVLPVITPYLEDNTDTLDVLILTGQSNAAYYPAPGAINLAVVNSTCDAPSADVYYYGSSDSPIQYGNYFSGATYDTTLQSYSVYPMYADGSWRIGSIEPALAQGITARTHTALLIINVAVPGAPIDFLLSESAGGQYAAAVIADAFSKLPSQYHSTHKLGYVFAQGESNSGTSIPTYVASFTTFNNQMNEAGWREGYVVQTRPSNGVNSSQAQIQIANTIPNVVMASTAPATFTMENGLMCSDNLHYSQAGRIIIGEEVSVHIPELNRVTGVNRALIGIIPVLILAGLAIGVVGSFIRSRD